jgi:hypothetical protein
MHTEEWTTAHYLGRLETMVSVGIEGIHRRLDYQDQQDREWRRFMFKRIDKKNGNGNHKIPYGKAAAFGVLLIIGILAQAYPGATKKASLDLLEKFLLSAVKG